MTQPVRKHPDLTKLNPATIRLIRTGFQAVHGRDMAATDLPAMRLSDAKLYLANAIHLAKLPAAGEPKISVFRKLAGAAAAGLILLVVIGAMAPSSSGKPRHIAQTAAKTEAMVAGKTTTDKPSTVSAETEISKTSDSTAKASGQTPAQPVQAAPQPSSGASTETAAADTKPQPAMAPPSPPAAQPAGSNCDPNYSGGCVPDLPYDLDCADIGYPVKIIGTDHYRLDRDDDGVGCESFR